MTKKEDATQPIESPNPVVAVEAARGQAYQPWVGDNGLIYGIDRFGTSAPFAELTESYGFTTEALVARVKKQLA